MSDILIRDVPEATVLEIDRRAGKLGISRNEYLRRWLNQAVDPVISVTVDDLQRVGQLVSDLAEPEVMREAWS